MKNIFRLKEGPAQKRLLVLGQATVTLMLLVLLLWNFNWVDFGRLFTQLPLTFYLGGIMLTGLLQLVYAYKWNITAKSIAVNLSFREAVEYHFIALFFNNFLPTTIGGDVVKVFFLGKRESYIRAGATVFIDRLLGFLCMSLISSLFLFLLPVSSVGIATARLLIWITTGILTITFVAAVYFPVAKWLERIHSRQVLLRRIMQEAIHFSSQISLVRNSPGLILKSLALVLIYYSGFALIYGWYMSVLGAGAVGFVPLLVTLLAVGILSNVPISVNGIGLREQLHFLMLGAMGVSKEVAVGISLLIVLFMMLVSLIGCVLWLRHNIRTQEVLGASTSTEYPTLEQFTRRNDSHIKA